MKKLTAFLIACAMLIGAVPGLAKENAAIKREIVLEKSLIEAPRYVMPLKSETTLFEDTLDARISAAADALREGMKKNAKNVTITIDYLDKYVDVDGLFESGEYVNFLYGIRDTIFSAALAHTGKPDEGDYIHWRTNDFQLAPGINYDYEKGCYYAYFVFNIGTYYTTAGQEAEVTERVAEVLESLDLEGDSDYMKIKKIYGWICENVVYDHENLYDDSYLLKYTAYAALINGTSVCQGYASLLYRMLLTCGIDCRLISGIGYSVGTSGAHAWNIVKLGNRYYNLDPTWDAGEDEYSFFLLNNESFTGHYRDEEYETSAFNAEYPMAEENYIPTDDDLLKRIDAAHDYIGKIDAKMTNGDAAEIIVTILDEAVLKDKISCYYTENGAFRRAEASFSEDAVIFAVKKEDGGKIFIWDENLRPVTYALK